MPNPQISFRLTPYQLARGLKILRTLEPNLPLISLSQLVKTIYIDYMAKTSLKQAGDVTPAELLEIELDCVSVKATTSEKIGVIGKSEAIAAETIVLLEQKNIRKKL